MKFKSFFIFGCILFIVCNVIFYLTETTKVNVQLNNNNNFLETQKTLASFTSSHILHPYLGFVLDYGADINSNKMGFLGPDIKINKSEVDYNVGIFGGSVAMNYYTHEKYNFASELSKLNPNKNIHVYSFALGGYKQPQQLITLQYLLALGYKFDLVVNIDGFNEVALSYSENYKNKVSSFFPRSWNLYSAQSFDKKSISLINSLEKLKQWQKFFSKIPFHIDNISNSIIINAYNKLQADLNLRLSEINKTYQTQGPELTTNISDEDVRKNIINTWFNSSLQMSRLAKANNFKYFEFLQPNQYLDDSKKFSNEELTKYINKDSPYGYASHELYPVLIGRVGDLRAEDVQIHDTTNLFKNTDETLYIDNCCHFNNKGSSLLTEVIISVIKSAR